MWVSRPRHAGLTRAPASTARTRTWPQPVRALSESKVLEPTNDPRVRETGAGVSHYTLLHGLVQHDAYHAGQIAILKKALE